MKKIISKTKTVSVEHSLSCDRCDLEVLLDEDNIDYSSVDTMEAQEFLSVILEGGYGAILGDGTKYTLDLCQHCVKDVLGEYIKRVD